MPKRLFSVIAALILGLFTVNAYANDLWSEIRKSFRLKDYSYIPEVRQQIAWLRAHPSYLTSFSNNSKRYIYYILEEIKARQLPGEFVLMPLIESNYNPFAYSHAGAAGLWQLMPGTGSGLGVKQNWWYEGRRDVKPSTDAALNYLQYLGDFFNKDWLLAIAAYDSGEGTVANAVKKNQLINDKTDFWSLRLPRETKAYLPRLLAVASVIRSPNYHRVPLPKQSYHPYFTEVKIKGQLDLNQAAKIANVPYSEILKLNPGHNRWTTGPNNTESLLIPISSSENFEQKLKKLSKDERMAWSHYTIAEGETLGKIAMDKKSSVSVIKSINHLSSDVIRPGQTLYIPSTKKLSEQNARALRNKIDAINHNQKKNGPHKVLHVVKKGETIRFLQSRYQVSGAAIRFWNQLGSANAIKPGKKLTIWVDKKKLHNTYTVKPGDMFSKIAKNHRLTTQQLKQLNPQIRDFNRLKNGEIIII